MWVRSTSVPARYLMTFTIISAVASAITLRLTWNFPAISRCRVTRYFESSTTATLTGSRADRLVKMPPLASQLPAYRQLRYWQKLTNSQGGQIGGSASINVSASGAVVVTNDATFRIDGTDGATSAAVNFNGGNYNVGGTFLGFIDGNGTFTLNNATITADTVKVGVFGSNGTLKIGGGNISANTLLHLYTPSSSGSGGIIDFVSNVTLNSSATAAVIAANTVTIENGVVVTIGASTSANVYTNVPNYSARSGGNNKTSDTLLGAVTTQPLGGQPPFDSPSTRVATRSTRTSAPVIHVTDSSQLSSLLDNATPGPNGKVRVSPVTRSRNAPVQGSTRTMAAELHRSVAAKARSGVLASRLQ